MTHIKTVEILGEVARKYDDGGALVEINLYCIAVDAGVSQDVWTYYMTNSVLKSAVGYRSGPDHLAFYHNGADRISINTFGNVGIGTTTPFNRLDVEGGLAVGAAYSGSAAAPANGAIIEGNVGIGTSNVRHALK